MTEIPMYPECEHGQRMDVCRTCQLEDSVMALTTVLRDIRRKGLTQELRNEIDILLGQEDAPRTPHPSPKEEP